MQNSILVNLLKSLTPEEIRKLTEYVNSPFFNRFSNVSKLYKILKKYYPEFSSPDITRENIYKQLYPGEPYRDTRIRNLFSRLHKLTGNFIAYNEYSKSRIDNYKYLVRALRVRHADRHFIKKHKEALAFQEKQQKYENYYQDMDLLNNEMQIYNNYKISVGKRAANYEEYFYRRIKFLKYSAIIKFLKTYDLALNLKESINLDVDITGFKEILNFVSNYIPEDEPHIKLQYNTLLLRLNQQKEKKTKEIIDFIERFEKSFDKIEKYNAYADIINYYRKLGQNRKKRYNSEIYAVVKEMVSKNVIDIENGYISNHTFVNIVESALVENEIQWAESFINNYGSIITPKFREGAYGYSLALLEFRKNNFINSINILSKLKYEDFYHYLNINLLKIQLFYELDYYDEIVYLIDAFRHLVYKNFSIPEEKKNAVSNFLKYAFHLITARKNKDLYSLEKLKQEICCDNTLIKKDWLEEKIAELKNKLNPQNKKNRCRL